MKLTQRAVDALATDKAELMAWDDELPGFGVRVFPTGKRSYLMQYRVGRRTRRVTIGDASRIRLEGARKAARDLFHQVEAERRDPSQERHEQRHRASFADLVGQYRVAVLPKKKPSTRVGNEVLLKNWLLPRFRNEPVADLTGRAVANWHAGLASQPYQANRALALLSHLCRSAEEWGMRPPGSNPCRHIARYPERKRERYLSAVELARLGEELRQSVELPQAVALIRALLLTGARRGELTTLRWREVDIARSMLRLEDSKTGAKVIHLNAAALEVITAQSGGSQDALVFPGEVDGRPLQNISRAWQRIAKRAGLDGVRLHDLRHSFASVAASGGASLPFIGALLGHRVPATTQRYAHLTADPLRLVAEDVGERLAKALRGG